MNRMLRIIASALLASTLISLAPISLAPAPAVQRAQATIPVIDPAAIGQAIAQLFQTILANLRQVWEWAQTYLLAALKKRILDMIVDMLVKWIQGGGSPKFVTDWRGFMKDVADLAVDEVTKDARFAFLCEPFNIYLRLAAFNPYPVSSFSQQISCSLDRVVGNVRSFYRDFRNGSFIALNEEWKPGNNIYGGVLLAYDEKNRRISAMTAASRDEAVAGNGFLTVKKCKTLSNGAEECINTTPGRLVGDAAAEAIGADIKYVVNAEQLSEYVTAIADAAFNRIIREGLAFAKTRGAPPGGSIPPGSRGACEGLEGAARTLCETYMGSQMPGSGSTFTIELDQVLGERNQATSTMTTMIGSLQNYVRALDNAGSPRGFLQRFQALSCQDKNRYMSEVQAEIVWARDLITNLQNRINQQRTIITTLEAARRQVLALIPPPPRQGQPARQPNFEAIERILGPLRAQGFLNISEAVGMNTQLSLERGDVEGRIAESIQILTENVELCRQGP